MKRCVYGVRAAALDDALLREIIALYDTIVGGCGVRYTRGRPDGDLTAYVRGLLEHGNAAEWRFGSRLSGHGKLFVWRARGHTEDLVRFSFDPNDVDGPDAEALVATFATAVDEFLVSRGFAVVLAA